MFTNTTKIEETKKVFNEQHSQNLKVVQELKRFMDGST